jgi:predicted nucleic acid-binding protein
MRILFDTNVIIDVAGERHPFFEDSFKVFQMAADKIITGIVGAGSVTDVYYIIKKNYHNSKEAELSIIALIKILEPVDTKAEDIKTAIKMELSDFEDAVICATAVREKADYILTRNVDDFANSPVKVITPAAFLKLWETIDAPR